MVGLVGMVGKGVMDAKWVESKGTGARGEGHPCWHSLGSKGSVEMNW